jgi:hypothetical protein
MTAEDRQILIAEHDRLVQCYYDGAETREILDRIGVIELALLATEPPGKAAGGENREKEEKRWHRGVEWAATFRGKRTLSTVRSGSVVAGLGFGIVRSGYKFMLRARE